MSMLNMYCAACPTNIRKFIINLPGIMALAAGIVVADGDAPWQAARAEPIPGINARVIAVDIPGASAIAQVGTFLPGPFCGSLTPIPSKFPTFIANGGCWIRTESWSAAGRISAPRSPMASGRRARSCRSTRASPT